MLCKLHKCGVSLGKDECKSSLLGSRAPVRERISVTLREKRTMDKPVRNQQWKNLSDA